MKIYFDKTIDKNTFSLLYEKNSKNWLKFNRISFLKKNYVGASARGSYVKIICSDDKLFSFLYSNQKNITFYLIGDYYLKYSFLFDYSEKIKKTTMNEVSTHVFPEVYIHMDVRTFAKWKLKFT